MQGAEPARVHACNRADGSKDDNQSKGETHRWDTREETKRAKREPKRSEEKAKWHQGSHKVQGAQHTSNGNGSMTDTLNTSSPHSGRDSRVPSPQITSPHQHSEDVLASQRLYTQPWLHPPDASTSSRGEPCSPTALCEGGLSGDREHVVGTTPCRHLGHFTPKPVMWVRGTAPASTCQQHDRFGCDGLFARQANLQDL